MAIKENNPRRTIDLSGPDGNVFVLIGLARRLGKQLELDVNAIQAEMMSANYENALFVFDREFGDYIDLELPPGMSIESIRESHLRANATPDVVADTYLR